MNLKERLNLLIQAATLSQKNGVLTLDEAVKAKSAIDVISTESINNEFISAINILIEIAVSSQKKGAYTLKDAYMIYIAIQNIEIEIQNEVNKGTASTQHVLNKNDSNEGNIINIPPKKIKKNS